MHIKLTKHIILFCILIIGLSFYFVIISDAKIVERIIAIINEDIITKTELDERVAKNKEMIRRLYNYDEARLAKEMEEATPEILETMIDELLFIQEAVKQGIQVPDSEVEQYIASLRKQYVSEEAFQKALSVEGYTFESLRKERHRAILLQQLIKREFESQTEVSNEEAREYYRGNRDKFPGKSDSVKLKHIFVKFPITDADKEKTLSKAQDILKKCKEGADFGDMARQFSDHEMNKEIGGDLGYFIPGMGDHDPKLEEAAAKLAVGEISDIIENPAGYDIIKVTDIKDNSIRAQRIFIAITPTPESEQIAREKSQSIIEELKAGEDFVQMVNKYSEDPLTKDKNGDWREVLIDSMSPDLYKAFNSFNEGEISQPVRTPLGFHIFKITQRQDLTEDEMWQIREFLMQSKLQEKIAEYAKELREKAYIQKIVISNQ